MKVLKAKKYAKMKKKKESGETLQTDLEKQSSSCVVEAKSSELQQASQVTFLAQFGFCINIYTTLKYELSDYVWQIGKCRLEYYYKIILMLICEYLPADCTKKFRFQDTNDTGIGQDRQT